MGVVYDAGALIAADRGDRGFWTGHAEFLGAGTGPIVPSVVVAQVSRSPWQAQLRRLLHGCDVVGLDQAGAHKVGDLLGRSRTTDVVDGVVVIMAAARSATIVTSDRRDIQRLLDAGNLTLPIVDV